MNTVTNTLAPRHLDEWLQSGVDEAIALANVWTIDDPRECDQLLNRNTATRWRHSVDLVPGWAVAGVDPKTGERIYKGAQFKPDRPQVDPITKKPRKYLSPARQALAGLFLDTGDPDFWSTVQRDKKNRLVITEGAKKAGAVLSQGTPCISLPGVTTGSKLGRLRPEIAWFADYGRPVYLAFDRDIVDKPSVRTALHNLGRLLKERGCVVYILQWRNDRKGIDDYLSSGGELEPVIASALTLEEWRDAWTDTPDAEGLEVCKLALRYKLTEEAIGKRLRWNDLKGGLEFDHQPADPDEVRLYLALKHNLEIPRQDADTIIPAIARREKYSPVTEYLRNCAEQYDADPELLDSLAREFLGSDSPLHASYLRKTLIAAVGRALSPGCKLDTVCILSGGQGVGKSSFWKLLAGEEWFDDSVGAVSDKDERLKLHQSWFIEWAELETIFRRKDIAATKAFITTQVDLIRPPYGRAVKEYPRPSIIVGSTNEHEFLADPTGSRRFWVIPVQVGQIPLDRLAEERDRIWAAATHAYLSGERWILSTEERKQAAIENQDYQISDPWEEVVLTYCEGLEEVSIPQILLEACHVEVEQQDKRSQMRIAAILKGDGWRSVRRSAHGIKRRIWISSLSTKQVGPGCHQDPQSQVAVGGQPQGQPQGQPGDNLGVKPENSEDAQYPSLGGDNRADRAIYFAKSTTTQGSTLCSTQKLSSEVDAPVGAVYYQDSDGQVGRLLEESGGGRLTLVFPDGRLGDYPRASLKLLGNEPSCCSPPSEKPVTTYPLPPGLSVIADPHKEPIAVGDTVALDGVTGDRLVRGRHVVVVEVQEDGWLLVKQPDWLQPRRYPRAVCRWVRSQTTRQKRPR